MTDIFTLYANEIFAWIGTAMAVLALGVWVAWAIKRRSNGHWMYALPPIALAGNYVGFYLAVLLTRLGVLGVTYNQFRLWTSFSWSFTMTLLFGLGIIVYLERLHFGPRGGRGE